MSLPARERTEQKLAYADIHVGALENYVNATSNDVWENAHQESCFYHLAGSVEALLHEINHGYRLGLPLHRVSWTTVPQQLDKANRASPALSELDLLRNDPTSWLSFLFEWRNHGTHRGRVGRIVNMSTHSRIDNEFTDPRSGSVQAVYPGLGCMDVIRRLRTDVRNLIDRCRAVDSALI